MLAPDPLFVDHSFLNRHRKKDLTPEQPVTLHCQLLASQPQKRDAGGNDDMDGRLVVNLGVHLQLAKKFDVSRIIIYCICMRMFKSFTTNRDGETYLAVSQKNKNGR